MESRPQSPEFRNLFDLILCNLSVIKGRVFLG